MRGLHSIEKLGKGECIEVSPFRASRDVEVPRFEKSSGLGQDHSLCHNYSRSIGLLTSQAQNQALYPYLLGLCLKKWSERNNVHGWCRIPAERIYGLR